MGNEAAIRARTYSVFVRHVKTLGKSETVTKAVFFPDSELLIQNRLNLVASGIHSLSFTKQIS